MNRLKNIPLDVSPVAIFGDTDSAFYALVNEICDLNTALISTRFLNTDRLPTGLYFAQAMDFFKLSVLVEGTMNDHDFNNLFIDLSGLYETMNYLDLEKMVSMIKNSGKSSIIFVDINKNKPMYNESNKLKELVESCCECSYILKRDVFDMNFFTFEIIKDKTIWKI